MKILITGGFGFIGKYIYRYLKDDYELILTGRRKVDNKKENFEFLDIIDKKQVKSQLLRLQPDIIIHLAAIKDLNFCQQNKEIAYNINVQGTENLIEWSMAINAQMIFLSTDYVFDGQKGMYKEEDTPNPQTIYGMTKLEAERLIKAQLSNYTIIRTGGVFGFYNGITSSLILWVLQRLKEGKTIDAYIDVYNSPTPLEILAEGINKIIKRRSLGVFHIAGSERINRFNFFKRIAEYFGFNPDLIIPVKRKQSDGGFLRPRDISLDITKSQVVLNMEKKDSLINGDLKLMKESLIYYVHGRRVAE